MNSIDRIELRRTVLARRDGLAENQRRRKGSLITSSLLAMPELFEAATVFVYIHYRSEVPTRELILLLLARKKTVAVPCTVPANSRLLAVSITDPDSQVRPGYRGIPEPFPWLVETGTCKPEEIDAVIVPGSVFDRRGGRLGYGGGYYDRFLAFDAPRAVRIGPAYELQLIKRVPLEPHDQLMDFVVTEKAVYDCRRNRHAQDSSVPG